VGFDELTALGNAVVPAVAEHIGRLIAAHRSQWLILAGIASRTDRQGGL